MTCDPFAGFFLYANSSIFITAFVWWLFHLHYVSDGTSSIRTLVSPASVLALIHSCELNETRLFIWWESRMHCYGAWIVFWVVFLVYVQFRRKIICISIISKVWSIALDETPFRILVSSLPIPYQCFCMYGIFYFTVVQYIDGSLAVLNVQKLTLSSPLLHGFSIAKLPEVCLGLTIQSDVREIINLSLFVFLPIVFFDRLQSA